MRRSRDYGVNWRRPKLSVTRAGFYAWLQRPESERSRIDQQLIGMIRTRFLRERCNLRRAADTPIFTCLGTYVWTAEGWLLVAVVLDLYSRRVVGWSMQTQMVARWVIDAMLMAIWRRGPKQALLHHCDRGSQYSSEDFQRLFSAHGVTCSRSRSESCWVNSAVESFFSTMKTECTNRKSYATRDQARADVFDYIATFYNLRRRHSTLNYVSPAEFERMSGLC